MGRALAIAAAALAGCAAADAHTGATAPPPAPLVALTAADVGLRPGESMTFEVRIGGLLAGEAALAVGQVGAVDGRRAVVVRSRAATAGAVAWVKHIVDEATTTIDLDTGQPLHVESRVEVGATETTGSATFGPRRVELRYRRGTDPERAVAIATGGLDVLDMHAAMGQVRGWRGEPGATRSVYLIGGRRLWRVDLRYVGAHEIGGASGNRRAIQLDGLSYFARPNRSIESAKPARTFSVWLSDDADRVPLKVSAHTELGEITMDLTEYQRP